MRCEAEMIKALDAFKERSWRDARQQPRPAD